jgi:hypothetical protein
MNERLIYEGRRAELKMRKMKLETAISANIKACKSLLAAASVTPIADMDLDGALVNLREAAQLKVDLAETARQLRAVEQELGL